jgi:hypothetical protein
MIELRLDRLAGFEPREHLGDVFGGAVNIQLGKARLMRRDEDFRQREQRIVRRDRLVFLYVEPRAAEVPALDGRVESFLVHERAAGDVDQARALFHRGHHAGVDHVRILCRRANGEHDEIGVRHGFLQMSGRGGGN